MAKSDKQPPYFVGDLSTGSADLLYKVSARQQTTTATRQTMQSIDIREELARRERIRNDDIEQDIRLKRTTLDRLFTFLTVETSVIFTFALFQAIRWPQGFHLEDWSFKLLVTATIAQITGMLFVAVRYLFPKSNRG